MNSSLLIIPAYNEAESLGPLLEEVKSADLSADVLVVDDGSQDDTVKVAQSHGVEVLQLPKNVGVGGAVQAGYTYAFDRGYDFAVRIDSDGQHPPASVAEILAELQHNPDVDMVVASRFLVSGGYTSTPIRMFGTNVLTRIISRLCNQKISDPTSGFIGVNRAVIAFFSERYPRDYPETQALGMLYRHGYRFSEIPVAFRARSAGESSLHGWVSWKFVLKIIKDLMLFKFRKVDAAFVKRRGSVESQK